MSNSTRHIEERFALYEELVGVLPDETFGEHLGALKSNTIGEQP